MEAFLRSLTLLFVSTVLFAQSSLDVTSGLSGMTDRYLTDAARKLWEARSAQIAQIRTPAAVKDRQSYIRRKLIEEVGGFPEKTPLHPRITGSLDRDGYKVEKLIFESQPNYFVTANVFVPKTGRPPYPAVLGTAGHSLDGKANELYQRVWISLAKRGFLVLAYDPPGQGERLEYFDPATGKSKLPGGGTGEHSMAAVQCLLTGTNVARWFIWDGIRAFDYLETRPDVDPKRIAVAGNSGGGTQSSYLAAFEPRLASAAPSCYLTSWEKLWSGPGPQDGEQVFTNFLKDGLDFPDFLIAFAPKPIHMATAIRDYFPIDGARATYAEAKRIFDVMGAADHAGYFEFDDTHGWSQPRREATYRWFAKSLQNRQDDGKESEFFVDTPKDLQCSETGQVASTFPHTETVQSMNAALAQKLYEKRAGAGGKDIPRLVRTRLAIAAGRATPQSVKHASIERQGYMIEKIEIRPEAGITVPALAFVPSGGPPRKQAVLYVNAAGKAADAREGGPVEAMVRAGNVVLAIDPRGWGESANPPGQRGDDSAGNKTAMRALLVGKSMAGMQTEDVLSAFEWLAARTDVNPGRISIIGKGNGGVLALYAAALEPRISRVACEKSPTSYMDIVRAKMQSGITGIVVPGVLRDFDLPDVEASLKPRPVWRVTEERPDYASWLRR
jgi:cephalosporin-C deacetylase-like acetyl esterase